MPYITFTRRIRLILFELLWSQEKCAWYIRRGSAARSVASGRDEATIIASPEAVTAEPRKHLGELAPGYFLGVYFSSVSCCLVH